MSKNMIIPKSVEAYFKPVTNSNEFWVRVHDLYDLFNRAQTLPKDHHNKQFLLNEVKFDLKNIREDIAKCHLIHEDVDALSKALKKVSERL